ncbi:caspase family protein, partial [Solihabitans fulvus]
VTDTYQDTTFSQLRAPHADAEALAAVLRDPEIGDYSVEVLTNTPAHEVKVRVNRLFSTAHRDDLILLYVSGHGVKDEAGRLYLVSTDTER